MDKTKTLLSLKENFFILLDELKKIIPTEYFIKNNNKLQNIFNSTYEKLYYTAPEIVLIPYNDFISKITQSFTIISAINDFSNLFLENLS